MGDAKNLIVKPIAASDANRIVRKLHYYFLDPTARDRLTVPILPFSEIDKRGAGMYKGTPRQKCAVSIAYDAPTDQAGEGGSTPTTALQPCRVSP